MLVDVISFDIHDYKNHKSERFLVEATQDNFDMIGQQRNTRNTVIDQMFDFQFARERRSPKFLEFGNAFLAALDNSTDEENEIDSIDEMYGVI